MPPSSIEAIPFPKAAKPRPAVFRALGKNDPPKHLHIGDVLFSHVETFKHDSWAATALYQSNDAFATVKFNRRQWVGPIPMGWLGRFLAKHEAKCLNRLSDQPNIPKALGPVSVEGKVHKNALARQYIAGHPIRKNEELSEAFFEQLEETLDVMHRRRMAYLDLHKRENIIVGNDGQPWLIDFQVSFLLPSGWWTNLTLLPWLLRLFQKSDRYHVLKHFVKHCDSGKSQGILKIDQARPFWIRVHRVVAVPLRTLRRKMLVLLGVRQGKGRVETEHFIEDGLRSNKAA